MLVFRFQSRRCLLSVSALFLLGGCSFVSRGFEPASGNPYLSKQQAIDIVLEIFGHRA